VVSVDYLLDAPGSRVRAKTKDGPDFAVGYLLQQVVADDPAVPGDVGHSVSRSVAGTQGGHQVGVHLALGHQLHRDDDLAHRLDYTARVEPSGNFVSPRTAKRHGVASAREDPWWRSLRPCGAGGVSLVVIRGKLSTWSRVAC